MGIFKQIFHNDGSMGLENTVGNMRIDLSKPDEGPTFLLGHPAGGFQTVVRPDGQVAQERVVGNMRFSTDKDDFDLLF